MSDFIIPQHIWENKEYTPYQKLIIGAVYDRRPEPVLLDDIASATGLSKRVIAAEAMTAFLNGPKPDIEKCYLPNTEKRSFFVAYKYVGDAK